MRRFSSRPFRLLATVAIAVALVPSTGWAQDGAALERAPSSHDPSWDGAVKGALLGAGAMAGVLAVGYANCDAGCEAPAEGPMFAVGMGVGAGSGAAAGWLIDKLHKARGPARSRSQAGPALIDDPLTNGALIGAAVGAGAGLGAVGMAYAICADSDCGPSSDGPAWALGATAGAGIGLVTGLLIDKARRDPAPPIAVAVRADRHEKAVRVQWRF